ncbi:MAG TPA: hypothetical protein VIV12_25650, partial [Streptosporangiaceae bacterium]
MIDPWLFVLTLDRMTDVDEEMRFRPPKLVRLELPPRGTSRTPDVDFIATMRPEMPVTLSAAAQAWMMSYKAAAQFVGRSGLPKTYFFNTVGHYREIMLSYDVFQKLTRKRMTMRGDNNIPAGP